MLRYDIFGFFDSAEDEIPTHDPGLETNCPICGNKLEHPIKTISLMREGDNKSYFYRTHKSCYENMAASEISLIEGSLIDYTLTQ